MTNTIPNVPRELLCELRDAANEGMNATTRQHQIDHFAGLIAKADALLSDPSPAGVDGLNTDRNAAFKAYPESGYDWGSFYLGWKARGEVEQAIIDGLRGENHQRQRELRLRQSQIESSGRIAERAQRFAVQLRTERDQQAQRIGELEGLLRAESARVDFLDAYIVTADAPDTGKVAMLADSGTLRECIDFALSAGKEGE